ncbi:MAG: 2OG-Fe(II) oxygenase [Polyangia bacterium]
MPGLVDVPTLASLRAELAQRDADGQLTAASIGNASAREGTVVRGDRTAWLDDHSASGAEGLFRALVEDLRLAVNAALYLGLFRFDGHYALYPPGATYARHLDRFRDDDRRVVSLVLYLNEAWQPADGGALRLHLADGSTKDVLPVGGTVVAFLSEQFPHEVLAATRPRLALTGWLSRAR